MFVFFIYFLKKLSFVTVYVYNSKLYTRVVLHLCRSIYSVHVPMLRTSWSSCYVYTVPVPLENTQILAFLKTF